MNVLVLGGNGFIGSHLVDRLYEGGHKVSVLDKKQEIFRRPLPYVEYFVGDLGNRKVCDQALNNCDMVFHLVSTTVPKTSNDDPVFDVLSNVVETLHLLKQCVERRIKRVVFVSTGGAIYGSPLTLPVSEDSPTNPESSYGITKLAIEKYLALFCRLHGLDYVIVRPSNPYGPRQNPDSNQGVVAVFLGKIARNQHIEVWGDGNTIKDYIYIDDLVEGIFRAGFTSGKSRVFNLGSGIGKSVNDILRIIAEVVDHPFEVSHSPTRIYDVSRIYLDITLAEQQLDWKPVTTLDSGIAQTWDFIRQTFK